MEVDESIVSPQDRHSVWKVGEWGTLKWLSLETVSHIIWQSRRWDVLSYGILRSFIHHLLIKITILQSQLLYCGPKVFFLEGAAILDLNTLTFSLPLDMNLSNAMLLSKAGVTNLVSIEFSNRPISSPVRFRTRDMATGVCDVKLMSTLLSGILFIWPNISSRDFVSGHDKGIGYSRFLGVSPVGISSRSSCLITLFLRAPMVSNESDSNSRTEAACASELRENVVAFWEMDFFVCDIPSWNVLTLLRKVAVTSDKHSSCCWYFVATCPLAGC